MTALSLLGKTLKDDAVIEFLEQDDVKVVYDFDRLHENSPDRYWASLKKVGIELRFNEHQVLDTAFCFVEQRNDFNPVAPAQVGAPLFASFEIAKETCERSGLMYKTSANSTLWLKVLGASHDTHYEFKAGRLSKVTLMLRQHEP
jgi:hypothetical protein